MKDILEELCEVKEINNLNVKRLGKDEIEILEREFRQHTKWDTKTVKILSTETGYSKSKIYKWNWDKRHRKACTDTLN